MLIQRLVIGVVMDKVNEYREQLIHSALYNLLKGHITKAECEKQLKECGLGATDIALEIRQALGY